MTFEEHVALYPEWIQYWLTWLSLVMLGTPIILLILKGSRRDGLIVAGTIVLTIVAMQWLFDQVGFVRLLGLVHVILWTPLIVYLIARLRNGVYAGFRKAVVLVFIATIAVSLAFDYADVARYLLGERAPVTGPVSPEG